MTEHATTFRDERDIFPEDVNPGSVKVTTRTIRKKYGTIGAWADKGKRNTITDKYQRPDAIELHRTRPMAALAHWSQEHIGYPAETKRMDGASAVARLRTRTISLTGLALWGALSFSVGDKNPVEISAIPTPAEAARLPLRAIDSVFDGRGGSSEAGPQAPVVTSAPQSTEANTAPSAPITSEAVGVIPPVITQSDSSSETQSTIPETQQSAAMQIGSLVCDNWSFGATTPEGQDPSDDTVPVIAIGNLSGDPVASLNPDIAQAFFDTVAQKNRAEGISIGASIPVGTEIWYPTSCSSDQWQELGLVS